MRYVLGGNVVTLIALCLFLAYAAMAILGPAIARNWFGTDQLGRDIISRVIVAARVDLGIALASVVLVFAAGGLAGLAAGFFGGWVDALVGRIADTIIAFPRFAPCNRPM